MCAASLRTGDTMRTLGFTVDVTDGRHRDLLGRTAAHSTLDSR
jgi:hypothetical protein